MSLQPDELKSEIEKALEALAKQQGLPLAAKIRSVLYANLDRGRLQNFVEADIARVSEYVARVVEKYRRLHGLLHQLQIEKVAEAWEPVLHQMEKWAYRFLVQSGYPEVATTWQNALDCASEAAGRLHGAYFPYDTEFDPWARVIVRNVCMKFIGRAAKDVSVIEESYDSLENSLQNIAESTFSNSSDPNDLHSALLEAVDQLTPSRREVIVLKYYQDLSPAEIAEKLGKSVRAVHSLQFRALQDLRKFLTKNRDKLNE